MFQPLKYGYLLVFLVFCDFKINIYELLVGQNKTSGNILNKLTLKRFNKITARFINKLHNWLLQL